MAILIEGTVDALSLGLIAKVFAKGVKATMDMNVAATALEALGYKVTQTTGWDNAGLRIRELIRRRQSPLADFLIRNGFSDRQTYGEPINKNDPLNLYTDDPKKTDALKAGLESAFRQVKSITQLDAEPKIDDVIYVKAEKQVPDFSGGYQHGRDLLAITGLMIGRPAFMVAGPGGDLQKFIVRVGEDASAWKSAPFWTWLYRSGLKEAAVAFLGGEEGAKTALAATQKAARTIENTGTCQICSQNVKLDSGSRIVHHGFRVPRWGRRIGGCFGVDYKPYEISADACRDFIGVLENQKASYENVLRILRKKPPKIQVPAERFGDENSKQKDIAKGDPEYERELQKKIDRNESILRQIKSDIKFFNQRILQWKPDQLPHDKLITRRKELGLES